MKRVLILLFLTALLLCGCTAEEKKQEPQEPYTSVIDGISYYVDPEAQTVTAQGHKYRYRYIDNKDTRGIRIIYPNGAVVTDSHPVGGGMGGISWSNADVDIQIGNGKPYADCYDLLDVIPAQAEEKEEKEEKGDMIYLFFYGLPLIALGWWTAARPYTHWYWAFGWRYKDAEPSDEALFRIMGIGYFLIVCGIILTLIGILV